MGRKGVKGVKEGGEEGGGKEGGKGRFEFVSISYCSW